MHIVVGSIGILAKKKSQLVYNQHAGHLKQQQ